MAATDLVATAVQQPQQTRAQCVQRSSTAAGLALEPGAASHPTPTHAERGLDCPAHLTKPQALHLSSMVSERLRILITVSGFPHE